MCGIDTLHLSLQGFEISRGALLEVQPSTFNAATKKKRGDYPLWTADGETVTGARAYLNSEHWNVTVQPRGEHAPLSPVCLVSFSAGKLVTGSNYEPADFATVKAASKQLESELRDAGIETNIERAKLTRLDACRNLSMDEPFKAYHPALKIIRVTRTENFDYGTTYLIKNGVHQTCFYDKRVEMKRKKRKLDGLPANCLRVERRLMTGRKIRDVLGFGTVGELLEGFEQVALAYKSALKKQVFKHSPEEIHTLTAREIGAQLDQFKARGRRYYVRDYFFAKGVAAHIGDMDAVLLAVSNLTESRATQARLRHQIEVAQVDALSLRKESGSRRTLGELYRELEKKALA
jgi:hypothetical protein